MKKNKFIAVQLVAVLVCTLTLVATTFSWANPHSSTAEIPAGNGMQWSDTFTIREENCSAKTYIGVKNDQGAIYYNEDASSEISFEGSGYAIELSGSAPSYYFKTVLQTTAVSTKVSLCLQNVNVSGNAYLGVHSPTNIYNPLANGRVTIASDILVEQGEQTVVYWYIQSDGNATVNLNTLYTSFS